MKRSMSVGRMEVSYKVARGPMIPVCIPTVKAFELGKYWHRSILGLTPNDPGWLHLDILPSSHALRILLVYNEH